MELLVPSGVSRLADLARWFDLDTTAQDRLAGLLSLLSEPTAPTAVHDPAVAVDVHLADSLVALELAEVSGAGTIADLGSGAGLPGLALAITLPGARVALVESVGRRCEFLARAVETLGLENVEIVCARAEAWEAGLGACDVVCARALAGLPVVCEYAAPLLCPDGVLVAWKGRVGAGEAASGAAAAVAVGLAPEAVRDVVPYPGSARRTLHVFRKVAPTPPGFPRRPGMAAKRPLGIRRTAD